MTVNGVAAAFYVYDAIGNLTAKTESLPGMANDAQLTLSYPASGAGAVQPHAVTAVSGTQSLGFQYDADGNLAGSPAQYNDPAGQPVSVTSVFNEYDAANHLAAADAGPSAGAAGGWACMDFNGDGVVSILDLSQMAASYNKAAGQPGFNARADLNWSGMVNILDLSAESAYYGKPCTAKRTRYLRDGDGALLERDDVVAGATGPVETWTVYIGGIYEVNSDGSVVKYYSAYGRSIAVRRQPAAGGAGALSWLVADQLGTTTLALDATGAVVADARYWPYGAVRSSTTVTQTDRLYTGQRQEAAQPALGLYDYRARYYSTLMGRFVSADPTNGSGLNRYAYVLDNPLRYTDPSGQVLTDTGPGGGCGGDWACALIAAWDAFHPGQCWGGCPVWPVAAPAPATIDPGLALLASARLTSPALVQQALRARDLAACAADPAACEALGGPVPLAAPTPSPHGSSLGPYTPCVDCPPLDVATDPLTRALRRVPETVRRTYNSDLAIVLRKCWGGSFFQCADAIAAETLRVHIAEAPGLPVTPTPTAEPYGPPAPRCRDHFPTWWCQS